MTQQKPVKMAVKTGNSIKNTVFTSKVAVGIIGLWVIITILGRSMSKLILVFNLYWNA